MTMSSLKSSGKGLIVLTTIAAVLLGGDAIVYVLSSRCYQRAQTELSSREAQVENSRKVAVRLEASRVKYEDMESKLAVLERSVSKAEYVPTMLKQLENAGKAVKLDVVGVRPIVKELPPPVASRADADSGSSGSTPKPTVKKEQKPYDSMVVDIQLKGSYWNTMKFLDGLTRFPKIVAVNKVQMSPGNECQSEGGRRPTISPRLNVTLNLSAFIFPVEKNPTPTVGSDQAASVLGVGETHMSESKTLVRVGGKNWRSGHEAG